MEKPLITHNENPKGSEWSKWDLHFHTPTSYDYEDKSVTNQDIIDILVKNEVRVVAITDHHVIDVPRIKELQELGKGKITILPGIEFLGELRGKEPIHYIAIFSENCNLEHVWGQIENCTEIKNIKGENKKHNEVYCDLLDTIKIVKSLGGIISIHAGNKTNSVENITHSLPHGQAQKTDIAHNVDIYELGKETDQEGYAKIVFPAIGKILPMILCSDNHNVKNYAVKQNLWIKAVPTFEGLKQIIFEPQDRIKIQYNKPEIKTPYLVIDKVRFIDKSDKSLFSSNWIELNSNLNVIIGGKSSGKSLLLFHIAKAIDEKQTISRFDTGYSDLASIIDFEVLWKDEKVDITTSETKNGQITYIPQLYINSLAEKNGKEHLYDLIQSISIQNEGFKKFFDTQNSLKEGIKKEILIHIHQVFDLRNQYTELNSQIKKIGTKEQIQTEIQRIKAEIDKLKKEAGFSDKENEDYENFQKALEKSNDNITNLNTFKSGIELFIKDIAAKKEITNKAINKDFKDFMQKAVNAPNILILKEELEQNIESAFKSFLAKANKELNAKIDIISKEGQIINKIKEDLKPFQTKIQNQELLRNSNKELDIQTNKLTDIIEKEKEISIIQEKGIQNTNDLFSQYQKLFNIYEAINNELQKDEFSNIGEGLIMKTKVILDIDKFSNSFTELFDLRTNLSNFFDCFDSNNQYIYNETKHFEKIKLIYNKLPKKDEQSEIRLKSWSSIEDLYTKLFEDYFKIDYSIVHKNDDILKMSPGKRGLVLLQLILHISNAIHPILIDQPEDNLDNRTIYDELKQFIKDKKTKRQIILVTHNANLVVSTDAENVIVANQAGQRFGIDNTNFRFEYVSGPLENTFKNDNENSILHKFGIREHVCDILEGGKEAFLKREEKYGFKK